MYSQVNLFLVFVTLQVGIICFLKGPTILLVNATYLESTSLLGISSFTSSSLLGIFSSTSPSLLGTSSSNLLGNTSAYLLETSSFSLLDSTSFLLHSLFSQSSFLLPQSLLPQSFFHLPMMDTEDPYLAIPNPYLALDVGYTAGEREISTAYKRLALLTHPDKTKGDDTEFKAINAAYQILNDPAEKFAYDLLRKSHYEKTKDNRPKEKPPNYQNNYRQQHGKKRRKAHANQERDQHRPQQAEDKFSCLLNNNPKVYNLTGVELTNAQKQAILLGPGFIPCALMTPKKIEESKKSVRDGVEKLKTKIKWRYHFESAGEMKPDNPLHFKSKTPTAPPTATLDAPILRYFSDIDSKLDEAMAKLESHVFTQHNALPTHIARAISEFQNNKKIVMCMVDKGGGMLPVSIEIYDQQVDSHLLVEENYKHWPAMPELSTLFHNIRAILSKFNQLECAPGKLNRMAAYMLQDEGANYIRFCQFYPVFKMHKTPYTTRPIAPNLKYPTYFVSKFLHFHLWPVVKQTPAFINDSKDLIKKIGTRTFPAGTTLGAADIISMYVKIPVTTESMRKIRKMILKYGPAAGFDMTLLPVIEDLTWFIMTNVFIESRGRYFQQVKGIPMGSPASVAIAVLVVGAIHDEIMEEMTLPIEIVQFVDDIQLIGSELAITNYGDNYNEKVKNPDINLEMQIGKQVNYMELTLTIPEEGGTIQFNTYQKPTRVNLFLLFTSDHAPCIFRGIVTTAMNRERVNNSRDEDYESRIEVLKQELLARQYPLQFLNNIMKSHKPIRSELLKSPHTPINGLEISLPKEHSRKKKSKTLETPLIFICEFNSYTQLLPLKDVLDASDNGWWGRHSRFIFGGYTSISPTRAFNSAPNLQRLLTIKRKPNANFNSGRGRHHKKSKPQSNKKQLLIMSGNNSIEDEQEDQLEVTEIGTVPILSQTDQATLGPQEENRQGQQQTQPIPVVLHPQPTPAEVQPRSPVDSSCGTTPRSHPRGSPENDPRAHRGPNEFVITEGT